MTTVVLIPQATFAVTAMSQMATTIVIMIVTGTAIGTVTAIRTETVTVIGTAMVMDRAAIIIAIWPSRLDIRMVRGTEPTTSALDTASVRRRWIITRTLTGVFATTWATKT